MSQYHVNLIKFITILCAAGTVGAVGLIFALVGAVMNFSSDDSYIKTDGTISRIEKVVPRDEDENSYEIYVDYIVDGIRYEDVRYPYSSSSMHEGDTVVVEYDPQNPMKIQAPGVKKLGKIFMFIGVPLTVLAVIMFTVLLIQYRKTKNAAVYEQYPG